MAAQTLTVALLGEVTMRFTSLPGCKLSGVTALAGVWSNGTTVGALQSGFHADHGGQLTWSNDAGTCALAGKQEAYEWESAVTSATARNATSNTVVDLTSPGTPTIVTK